MELLLLLLLERFRAAHHRCCTSINDTKDSSNGQPLRRGWSAITSITTLCHCLPGLLLPSISSSIQQHLIAPIITPLVSIRMAWPIVTTPTATLCYGDDYKTVNQQQANRWIHFYIRFLYPFRQYLLHIDNTTLLEHTCSHISIYNW